MRSSVVQHLPSSVQHHLVAHFSARTMEGLACRAAVSTTADEDLCGRGILPVLLSQSHGHRRQGFR
jgi:hypothetical protein